MMNDLFLTILIILLGILLFTSTFAFFVLLIFVKNYFMKIIKEIDIIIKKTNYFLDSIIRNK